jgi:hypothetical protein
MKALITKAHLLSKTEKKNIKGGGPYPITVNGVYYPSNCWVGNATTINYLCGCLDPENNFYPGQCGAGYCAGLDAEPYCVRP